MTIIDILDSGLGSSHNPFDDFDDPNEERQAPKQTAAKVDEFTADMNGLRESSDNSVQGWELKTL